MTIGTVRLSLPWRADTTGVQNGTPFSTSALGTIDLVSTDVRVGIENPKWRSKVARLENATNPYSRQSARISEAIPGKYRIYRRETATRYRTIRGSGWFCQPLIGSLDPYLANDPNVSNQALVRFVKKCKAAGRTYRGFVGLGEMLETISAFRHPLKSLKKGFSDYGRAVERNARERVRGVRTIGARRAAVKQAISGTYLEFANGWLPLIRDIDDLSNTVARRLEMRTPFTQRVEASASTTFLVGGISNGWTNSNELWYRPAWGGERVVSCRLVGVVKVEMRGSSSFQRAFGVLPSDFVPAIWELLPLSYVANAFVDITGSLETLGFDPSVLAWCSRSNRTRVTAGFSGADLKVVNSVDTLQLGKPSVMKVVATSLVRDNPKSFIAWPVLRVPGGSYNWARLANFTSLFIQFRSHSLSLWKMIG